MGPTPDRNTDDGALDAIARSLARGMSRREALRKGGAAFVAAFALSPSDAWAKATGRCPRHHVKCGTKCCPPGEICIQAKAKHGKPKPKPKCGCPPHTTRCRSTCAHTQTDVHNCGKCGHKCAAGQHCAKGHCVGCPTGQTNCNGKCVNVKHDPKNCGRCGHACAAGLVCANSTCVTTCPPGTTDCHGGCTNTTSDPQNCGTCGSVCTAGLVCADGSCVSTCPAGTVDCNGGCTNTTSDPQNCGTCGAVCGAGLACANGTCTQTCPAGQTNCSGVCVDVSKDPHNCGACGQACAAGLVCVNGKCSNSCPSGSVKCSGVCCAGNACCGSKCQTVHNNGVGGNYYDCNPLATPGKASTYSLALAKEARSSYNLSGGSVVESICTTNGQTSSVAIVYNNSQSVVWAYTGPLAGYVKLSSPPQFSCPTTTDPTWD